MNTFGGGLLPYHRAKKPLRRRNFGSRQSAFSSRHRLPRPHFPTPLTTLSHLVEIKHITQNKADFLDLLLLADESETMIARYLDRGEMFALYDDDLKSICIVTQEGKNLYEIKNLATYPPFQRQGYARRLIEYIENRYNAPGTILQVGTGDSPLTIPFYEHCGFRYSHRIPRFFTDNYPHPIFEGGKQLVDMIYLKKEL